jgi:hypothetical protein
MLNFFNKLLLGFRYGVRVSVHHEPQDLSILALRYWNPYGIPLAPSSLKGRTNEQAQHDRYWRRFQHWSDFSNFSRIDRLGRL